MRSWRSRTVASDLLLLQRGKRDGVRRVGVAGTVERNVDALELKERERKAGRRRKLVFRSDDGGNVRLGEAVAGTGHGHPRRIVALLSIDESNSFTASSLTAGQSKLERLSRESFKVQQSGRLGVAS